MEFKKNIPIYFQIMEKLKKDISLGVLIPGEKLLSTRELAIELQVNPNTISRVYRELEIENIVFTKRGMGTFIVEDKNILQNIIHKMANDVISKFVSDMKDLNIPLDKVITILEEIEEE